MGPAPHTRLQRLTLAAVLGFGLFTSLTVNAQSATDAMAECLVASSSEEDRLTLVKWMFSAMSLHPAVQELSEISDADRETASRDMAELMTRLLTVDCQDESKAAVATDGQIAMQNSFAVLGQVAGTELFTNGNVMVGMGYLQQFIDQHAINAALGIE